MAKMATISTVATNAASTLYDFFSEFSYTGIFFTWDFIYELFICFCSNIPYCPQNCKRSQKKIYMYSTKSTNLFHGERKTLPDYLRTSFL